MGNLLIIPNKEGVFGTYGLLTEPFPVNIVFDFNVLTIVEKTSAENTISSQREPNDLHGT